LSSSLNLRTLRYAPLGAGPKSKRKKPMHPVALALFVPIQKES